MSSLGCVLVESTSWSTNFVFSFTYLLVLMVISYEIYRDGQQWSQNIKDIHHELIKTQLVPLYGNSCVSFDTYWKVYCCFVPSHKNVFKNDVCSQS